MQFELLTALTAGDIKQLDSFIACPLPPIYIAGNNQLHRWAINKHRERPVDRMHLEYPNTKKIVLRTHLRNLRTTVR